MESVILLFALILGANAQTYCGHSWKSGGTRIKEESFTVTLNKMNPKFKKAVNDQFGRPRFTLTMWVNWSKRDHFARDWWVELSEIGKKKDLLQPTNDPEQDAFSARDWPGWFLFRANADPRDDESVLPFRTKRAIGVEGFYLVMNVESSIQSKADTTKLHSATFKIQLSNEFSPCRRDTSSELK